MLKGMTAQYLLRRTYKVGPHTTLLFHAAAGGVGLIACQWAASLGATVIGTVGSAGKALIARAHGCAHVINYREEDFVTMVKAYTNGKGVDVVYDSVGKDTFPGSLDCLKPLGLWVSFGQSSGPVPASRSRFCRKRARSSPRGRRLGITRRRERISSRPPTICSRWWRTGKVKVSVNQTYPLAEAARRRRSRGTTYHRLDRAVAVKAQCSAVC